MTGALVRPLSWGRGSASWGETPHTPAGEGARPAVAILEGLVRPRGGLRPPPPHPPPSPAGGEGTGSGSLSVIPANAGIQARQTRERPRKVVAPSRAGCARLPLTPALSRRGRGDRIRLPFRHSGERRNPGSADTRAPSEGCCALEGGLRPTPSHPRPLPRGEREPDRPSEGSCALGLARRRRAPPHPPPSPAGGEGTGPALGSSVRPRELRVGVWGRGPHEGGRGAQPRCR